jgi:gamma-F420-2:alpha-L-glutamate ligase
MWHSYDCGHIKNNNEKRDCKTHMKIWILYGDDIDSTADLAFEMRRFLSEGEKMGVEVKAYKPNQFDLLVTEEKRNQIIIDGKWTDLPDFIFPYFNHSDHSYFSLAIVRQFERMGVNVFNNADTLERVRDKLHAHQILAESGLPTPDTMLAKFPVNIDLVEETLGFPVIVKTLHGALGSGVFLIENAKSFEDLMTLVHETQPNILMIFQKFVASSKGRDLRIIVINGKAIAAMQRTAKEGDFKANFSQGGQVEKFEIDKKAEDIAIKTADALGIQVAGIDLLFTQDGYTICEANTFPGFKGLEKATGANVPEAIFTAMQKYMDKKNQKTGFVRRMLKG